MGSVYSYLFAASENGEIDPATGLTARQRSLVSECWKIVERHSLEIGVEIMIKQVYELCSSASVAAAIINTHC